MTSSYRAGNNRRRDERQTKIPEPVKAPANTSKNTKRWCRGVKGREHKLTYVKYNEFKRVNYGEDWRLLVCAECGKEIDGYYPHKHLSFLNRPAPDWVKD